MKKETLIALLLDQYILANSTTTVALYFVDAFYIVSSIKKYLVNS